MDVEFDGTIRVRRYLCRCCKRAVSLLPKFALPYMRFGIVVIAFFLVGRLLLGRTLTAAADAAKLVTMPYQRGQFWVRRFRQQAEKLCAALAALVVPPPAQQAHPARAVLREPGAGRLPGLPPPGPRCPWRACPAVHG